MSSISGTAPVIRKVTIRGTDQIGARRRMTDQAAKEYLGSKRYGVLKTDVARVIRGTDSWKAFFINPLDEVLFPKENIDSLISVAGLDVQTESAFRALIKQDHPGAIVETTDGRLVALRLDDFEGVALTPTIDPTSNMQTFVSGPVLERAERRLSEIIGTEETNPGRVTVAHNALPNWDTIRFALTPTDSMVITQAAAGEPWPAFKVVPFQHLKISLSASALNYGQQLFEGMKAQRTKDGRVVLFRPLDNARRMKGGAERILLNPVPEEYFLAAVTAAVRANERWIPPYGKGALYIRPVLIGDGGVVGINPGPQDTFGILCTPVGPYFQGGMKAISLLVPEDYHRSAPGNLGYIKAGGNYTAGMMLARDAHAAGFAEILYLDAIKNLYPDEVGAANFILVYKHKNGDRTIFTPPLENGTILPGVTRRSWIQIARDAGIEVIEKIPTINRIMKDERFVEAGCSGTAAVISPIGKIQYKGATREFGDGLTPGSVMRMLHGRLTAIQLLEAPDIYGWVHEVNMRSIA